MSHKILSVLCALGSVGCGTPRQTVPPAAWPNRPALGRSAVDTLPEALVTVDGHGELQIEFPPIDVPGRHEGHDAHGGMVRLPVHRVDVPVSGSFHRFQVEVLDSAGHTLPPDRLHHLILFDPDHRELFAPLVQRVLGAGKETGAVSLPKMLFGMPLRRGQRLILSGMLTNPDSAPLRSARLRLVLGYVAAGNPWPLRQVYPMTLDVAWPLGGEGGSKAFDLPPGRLTRSWEGSPAIAGTIIAVGGHVHDHAVSLELRDLTRDEVLWEGEPITDSTGHVVGMERGLFFRWHRLGIHVVPDHRYRITAVYDNPTGATIRDGGMASVSGLFVPDVPWPRLDPTDTLYLRDLHNVLRNMEGLMGSMGSMR